MLLRWQYNPRMVTLLGILWTALKAALSTKRDLILENAALQQQLSIYKPTSKGPRLRVSERVFWLRPSKAVGRLAIISAGRSACAGRPV